MSIKLKITKNLKNIHNSELNLRPLQITQHRTVFDNIQVLEIVDFCHKSSILDVAGVLDPPL